MGISTFAAPANLAEASDMAGDVWDRRIHLEAGLGQPQPLKSAGCQDKDGLAETPGPWKRKP